MLLLIYEIEVKNRQWKEEINLHRSRREEENGRK